MSEYTHKHIFFHKVSSDHQDNFEAFSRLSILLIADRTNTNSCQDWILVNFTNVAPAHSSIQYRQISWYHLIEETSGVPGIPCQGGGQAAASHRHISDWGGGGKS